MKTFTIVSQEKPWYGSSYWTDTILANSLRAAVGKAVRMHPNAVWYWHDSNIVRTNKKRMEHFQKINPDVAFSF